MAQSSSTLAVGVVCAALLVIGAQSLLTSNNRFQVAATASGSWRIDTSTGQVSTCRAAGYAQAPICSPFGAQTLADIAKQRASSGSTSSPQSVAKPPAASSNMDEILKGMAEEVEKPKS